MFDALRDFVRKLRVHLDDPNDVAKGVHVIDAMALLLGRGDRTLLRRMNETELGRKLLAERHSILELLRDRERLHALPEGSLGKVYVDFAEANHLYPEELAQIVAEARADSGGLLPRSSPDVAYLHDRYRDLHDLWHVVTGYGVDMGGELGLHAFQTHQIGYRAMMMTSLVGVLRAVLRGRFDIAKLWIEGRRRSKRSAYLLAQDWDTLLTRPLAEVHRELRLDPMPQYERYDAVLQEAPAAATP